MSTFFSGLFVLLVLVVIVSGAVWLVVGAEWDARRLLADAGRRAKHSEEARQHVAAGGAHGGVR